MPSAISPLVVEQILGDGDDECEWLRARVTASDFKAYRLAVAQRMAGGAEIFSVESGSVVWRALSWDSEQMGKSVARVDSIIPATAGQEAELTSALTDEIRRKNIAYATVRIAASKWALSHSLIAEGWLLIDSILTYAVDVPDYNSQVGEAAPDLRKAHHNDIEELVAEGRHLFRTGRFHSDPVVGIETADRIYGEWIRNSVSGIAAETVLLVQDDSGIAGFVTLIKDQLTTDVLRWPVMQIGLIGTFPRARQRGVATSLLKGARDYARATGARGLKVGTQLDNISASRLYEKFGFRLASAALTFRWASQGQII